MDGRYQLVERIGAGGMGVVYRAIDQVSGTVVAIKVHQGQDVREVARARREAEILARLQHPAIVRHFGDGVTGEGALYIVMAWVDGETAAQRLARDGFQLRDAVAMVNRLAGALAAAHEAGVIHRDIKPSNVLLAGNDPATAMLVDFGVSRIRNAVSLTRTGATVGTPGYMSPEQARGQRDVGPADDVFGLGCLLYECATSRPAFSGTNAAAVIAKILFAEPMPFHLLCPEAPAPLTAIVERMLSKPVAGRYADCAAVVTALETLGDVPAGRKRSTRAQVSDATEVSRHSDVHCVVAASRGSPEDLGNPPTDEQRAALAQVVAAHGAHVEVLATGAIVAHFAGTARDASRRAAIVALALRGALPGWSIVISSVLPDVAVVVDEGTALLTSAAMSAIFKRRSDVITLDRGTATLLGDEFEIEDRGRDDPRLIAKR